MITELCVFFYFNKYPEWIRLHVSHFYTGVDQSVHMDISQLSTTEYCGKLPMTCTDGITYSVWYRDGPKVTVSYQVIFTTKLFLF